MKNSKQIISRFLKKYQKENVKEHPNSVAENPLVSVIVQTYQHKNYIKDCLDSILSQKVDFSFEIILSDDDSNDGTAEICQEYAENYPEKIRLYLHSRKNNIPVFGKPSGRFLLFWNLSKVKGKYVAWLDGDDYWTDRNKLQIQADFLQEHQDTALVCTRFLNRNGETFREDLLGKLLENSNFRKFTIDDYVNNFFIHPSTSMFRKEAISYESFEKYTYFRDTSFFFELISFKVNSYGVLLPQFTSVYRRHSGGTHGRNQMNQVFMAENSLNIRTEIFLKNSEKISNRNFVQEICDENLKFFKFYLKKLDFKKAIFFLEKLIKIKIVKLKKC